MRLKVYGGCLFALGEQVRVVMEATSINQVAKRLGETHYTISRMWGETGNESEIVKAQENSGNPVVVSCLTRNTEERSIQELQDDINKTYQPKTYRRPYIWR